MKIIIFLVLFSFSFSRASAQIDTIGISLDLINIFSSENYQPHYFYANRFGLFNPEKQFQTVFNGNFFIDYNLISKFDTKIELDFVNNSFDDNFFREAYLELSFDNKINLFAGYKAITIGMVDETMSSGSLALSNNARPIPRISISIPEFTAVPFTFGYLEVKGILSHGWFEEDRITRSPYLHEKFGFARIGGKLPIRVKGGLVHFAQWGGERDGIKLPSSFDDYKDIFFAKASESDEGILWGEAANALGNHLGTIEFGLEIDVLEFNIDIYHQSPYEDNSGTKRFWRENRDRLFGVKLAHPKIKFIDKFLYEYIYTLQQTHAGLNIPREGLSNYGYGYGGRDNYYNNYLYGTGWMYKSRILGTPLFLDRERIMDIASNFVDPDRDFSFPVLNNRIKAHHFGVSGSFFTKLDYKILVTHSENYGTYGGINGGNDRWGSRDPNYNFDYYFDPPRRQWYYLLETDFIVSSLPNFAFSTSLAFDYGEMTKNIGLLLGLSYSPKFDRK